MWTPLCIYILSWVCWYVNLPYVLMYWVAITWLGYPSSHDSIGSIVLTSSCNSRRSPLNNWHANITRSVTLSPPSLALSSKILPISRLPTKGIVSSVLICCLLLLMPPIRSSASIHYAALVALILSIGEIIPSCSYYVKKGLVCIIITAPSSH